MERTKNRFIEVNPQQEHVLGQNILAVIAIIRGALVNYSQDFGQGPLLKINRQKHHKVEKNNGFLKQ